ncbi:MAG: hypothetical protein WCW03_01010 [Candidatus Paceibacterota bacterium]|jgi:mRNA-degrading endonuclease toxin of MazEF toxin-antitoxin module
MENIYFKDFDLWNTHKKHLDKSKSPDYFHERDIWWCAIGVNIGSEQDGKNDNFDVNIANKDSQILITQLRAISSRRLLRKIGTIKRLKHQEVIMSIIRFIIT